MIRPVEKRFRITQNFGERPEAYARFGLRGHNGIDFGVPVGTPVVAVDDGKVAEVADDPKGYGLYIKLKHAWGESLYAHLSKRVVTVGGTIARGGLVGLSGNTGNSTGPHLHFAVRISPYNRKDGWGGYSDPLPHFDMQTAQPPQAPQEGTRTMRIGRGAGPSGLNLQVIPFRNRLDWKESNMLPDSLVWQIVDVFTTQNGNWDVETEQAIKAAQMVSRRTPMTEADEKLFAGPLFGIDQWARDSYLFPPDDPRYCTEGGADHDILVCVQGTDGARLEGAGVAFSSDGPTWLQPPTDPDHIAVMRTKSHGWSDLTMFGGSTSYPPALGPWTAGKFSEVNASDLVTGMGMPWNWHVSTFIVYQATRWADLQTVPQTLEEALIAEGERQQKIRFNPTAAIQARIFADGFVPNSGEFDMEHGGVRYVAQRAEHLGTGVVRIYYCRHGIWTPVLYVVKPAG